MNTKLVISSLLTLSLIQGIVLADSTTTKAKKIKRTLVTEVIKVHKKIIKTEEYIDEIDSKVLDTSNPEGVSGLIVRSNVPVNANNEVRDRIYINDNKFIGNSGPMLHELKPGTYKVQLDADSPYIGETKIINISHGENKTIRFNLKCADYGEAVYPDGHYEGGFTREKRGNNRWSPCLPHGEGTSYEEDGSIWSGIWDKGNKTRGVYGFDDGTMLEGDFSDGGNGWYTLTDENGVCNRLKYYKNELVEVLESC